MSCLEDFASSVRAGDRGARGMGHLWHTSGGGSALSLFRLCAYPCWKSLRLPSHETSCKTFRRVTTWRRRLDGHRVSDLNRRKISALALPQDVFLGFVVVFWGLGRLAGASGLTRALPDASERTQVSAYPSPAPQTPIFFAPCTVLFLGAGGASHTCRAVCSTRELPGVHRRRASAYPNPVYRNAAEIFLRPSRTRLVPHASAEPSARPARSQIRIGVPRSRPRKHAAKDFSRSIRRCSRTRGHYPRLRSPLLEPPSHAEPPARPERSQTRIGVPKSHPQKHTANFFFFATSSALFPDAGGTTRVFQAFRSAPRASSRASASGGFPNSRFQQYPHKCAVGVDGPAVSLPPSTTPVFLVLLPSASLGPGFSCTVQNFSRTLSEIFFVFPLILHHLPSPSHISGPHPAASHNNPQRPQAAMSHHQSNKAKFLTYRATHPYVKEGPGWCYNIACAADIDIVQHAAGTLTDSAFLARMKWKVGHTNDWQRRQREYRGCDVGKTHIWICGWEVSRRYYCERLAQLEELCDGGERATIDCVCGVSHREYFSFATVGGFTEFSALMTRVITYMNEQPTCSFFDPPSTSTSAHDIYNLILRS
ncbi:hypothetical protein B0H14DRAFT_3455578 [Mycena olivaceomarginata]|nr:hypothetical protein B0H14DRAFT_3455578 [Mycena olivaceomarginata]